jgi:hypothetical protein
MANREYDLRTFARRAANNGALLEEYAQQKGIQLAPAKRKKPTKDELADLFCVAFQGLSEDKRDQISKETLDIYELACPAGFSLLLVLATSKAAELPADMEDWNNCGKVLWFFMNRHEIFQEAFGWFEIESRNGWRDALNLKRVPISATIGKEASLAKQISEYYVRRHFIGRNCVAEHKELGDRVCFRVLVEGQAKDEEIFKGGKVTTTGIIKPADEVIFMYYPNEGRLRTKADGGKDEVRELRDIFREHVLGEDTSKPANERVFNLDKLKDRNFSFATKPEDEIEYVKVFMLGVVNPFVHGEKTIIEVDKKSSKEAIYRLAENRHLDLDTDRVHKITQAKIAMKFPGTGKRGSVTIDLRWPNGCNLGEKELHKKAKDYLKAWGIDYDESIENAS